MKLTSDYPFWSVSNGLLGVFPPLEQSCACEAVVVGGGITGALTGYHLAEAGIDTVLLDRRDIGTGSTSASTGLLQYEVDVPLSELRQRIGAEKADRSYQVSLEALNRLGILIRRLKIRCGFAKRPSLFLARHKSELPFLMQEFAVRKRLGIRLALWDGHQIEQHFGFTRPGALFSNDGAEIDPHRLTYGLLTAGRRIGLRVFDRTKVARFKSNRSGIQLVTESGLEVKARRAVIAAGFESKNYLRGQAGHLKSTYALISDPVPHFRGWYRRSLIWETGSPYLYLRTTPENRIIVGGEDEDFTNPRQRDALIARKTRTLQDKFRRLFPELPLTVAYSWAGTFGATKDGLAYIGTHESLPHAYFALGYGGNGITYSLIAAELIRDAFLGRPNRDAELFAFAR